MHHRLVSSERASFTRPRHPAFNDAGQREASALALAWMKDEYEEVCVKSA